jgi:SRSO17 transposase
MTEQQIRSLGPELAKFLSEFEDCFGRSEPRYKLETYVRGQLSELPRKSVEPMALQAGMAPRTLQEFLASDEWDEDRMCSHVRRIVNRDHLDAQAIGVIDESGHPKKGDRTAGVSRQYCGNTGKIDNCVMTVHLTYSSFDGEFRTMLDSDLYLPQSWHEDRERCRRARIPDEVVYRPKYIIALEQLDRSLAAGVQFSWITADEWYAQKPAFIEGLRQRQMRFVLEVPKNLSLWLHDPSSGPETPAKPVENLLRYSRKLMRQPWRKYYVKDTDKGPLVWEVKMAPCWIRSATGVVGPQWLVVARNVLDPSELKYFISNASGGVPLEVILHVAFGRWPVERCLEDEKSELGLSHFETRCYPALKRHLLITQVSHLFLARQTQRLKGEKTRGNSATSARCHQRVNRCSPVTSETEAQAPAARRSQTRILAGAQCRRAPQPRQTPQKETQTTRHSSLSTAPM